MPTRSPVELVLQVAGILEDLDIAYALGGSMASSLVGEPRSTVDIDVAIRVGDDQVDDLLARTTAQFYVPIDLAHEAIRRRDSFNMLDNESAWKVDLFVTGDGVLDRNQIDRRVLVALPGRDASVWVTAVEDQILRKLDWFRLGGGVSDHQWRDVAGILRVHAATLDEGYLRSTARVVGLHELLEAAWGEITGD